MDNPAAQDFIKMTCAWQVEAKTDEVSLKTLLDQYARFRISKQETPERRRIGARAIRRSLETLFALELLGHFGQTLPKKIAQARGLALGEPKPGPRFAMASR
jgi:hypothetical protein